MGKTVWVDNVRGSASYDGLSFYTPRATIESGLALCARGDTLKICYTGTDYARTMFRVINSTFDGSSWDNFGLRIEGVDPSGGINRPALNCTGVGNGCFITTGRANYIEFKGLKFKPGPSENNAGIFVSNAHDTDYHLFIKTTSCWFDGTSTGDSTLKCTGIYVQAGSKLHLDVSFCYFKNLYYSTVVEYVEYNFYNNVIYNDGSFHTGNNAACYSVYVQGVIGTGAGYDLGPILRVKGNTFFSQNRKDVAVNAYIFLTLAGNAMRAVDNAILEVENNIVFGATHGSYSAGGVDFTPHFGYNLWGEIYGASASDYAYLYQGYGAYLPSTGCAVGDVMYRTGPTYTVADATNIFVNTSGKYLWGETGWIILPVDLRPKYVDLTGCYGNLGMVKGAIGSSTTYVSQGKKGVPETNNFSFYTMDGTLAFVFTVNPTRIEDAEETNEETVWESLDGNPLIHCTDRKETLEKFVWEGMPSSYSSYIISLKSLVGQEGWLCYGSMPMLDGDLKHVRFTDYQITFGSNTGYRRNNIELTYEAL